MATTILPIPQDVLPALQHDDVESLERLFREQYPSLHDEARDALSDESAYVATLSPIVERAFISAWERRAEFGSPEGLAEYLHAAVHRGVVRERARRAAVRRFEGHEGRPVRTSALATRECSVDDAWERVAAAVNADAGETQAATDAAAHAAGEARRHAAAEHLSGLARRRSWLVRAVAPALLAAAAVGSVWWLGEVSKGAGVDRALAAPDARVISVKPGQRATLTLGDGSRMTLGAGSQLRIPAQFGDEMRVVALDGAAAVAVAPGRERPLELRAGRASVVASAGAFTVRAYGDERATTVGVTEGSMLVKVGEEARPISKGGALSVTAEGDVIATPIGARTEELAWADGRFVVVGRPLRDVLPQLARWYATDLQVPDPRLLDRTVTMSASLDSTRSAVAALAASVGGWSGFEGKAQVLRDAADRPARPRARRTR